MEEEEHQQEEEEAAAAVVEESEEEVFADAETGGEDLDTTVEADVGNGGDVSMSAASPLSAAAGKSPASAVARSPLANQPVNV